MRVVDRGRSHVPARARITRLADAGTAAIVEARSKPFEHLLAKHRDLAKQVPFLMIARDRFEPRDRAVRMVPQRSIAQMEERPRHNFALNPLPPSTSR